jgi:peptidoglycan/xylan/chitin deacetylase (PgdA/CDA1 family)
VKDVALADPYSSPLLFRPPYGRLTIKQYNFLRKKYRIVFWDIMPYDFDPNFGTNKALKVLKRKMKPGSVIVLHDKRSSMAHQILQEFIPFALKSGYRFDNKLPVL